LERLAAVDQPVIGQGLRRPLIAGAGLDQHVAPAERRDWAARVVLVAAWRTPGAIRREIALAVQIKPLRPGSRRRPALCTAPVVGGVVCSVVDPGARRVEYGRLVHDAGALALQPVVEPGEIGVVRPEVAGVDKGVLVGADPQFLGAGASLNVVEGRQHARLEDVEPSGDVKSWDVDRAAEIVLRAKYVGSRMADNLIEEGLPGGEIRIAGQRQPQPIR
jgi:hypothetical protein